MMHKNLQWVGSPHMHQSSIWRTREQRINREHWWDADQKPSDG